MSERHIAERQLIVNADDFGLSPGVTRGILEAMSAGVVTSTSVIVNMPDWDDSAARMLGAPAAAGFGLHLNLVTGRPLTDARSLVDRRSGRFHSLDRLVELIVTGRVDPDDIRRECVAQLARLRSTGVPISHLDSHRHVHALAEVRRAIEPLLDGLPVRYPVESLLRAPGGLRASVKRLLLAAAAGRSCVTPPANRRADFFAGISLQGTPRFAGRLAQLLDRLPVGITELMVHPGYADDALSLVDSYTAPREAELAHLTSPALRDHLRRSGVRLVAGRAVPTAA
jgi:predicted glycoside hydrolase/deacetylase ChbG (UPF0249 family)